MNEYEQERLANIAKNEALLKEIGLTGIKHVKPKKPLTPAKKPTPKKYASPAEPVHRRTSSRLSGIPAESELAKRRSEEAYEASLEKDRLKRARVEGPLELSKILEGKGVWNDAQKLLSDLTKQAVGSAGPEVIEIKSEPSKELKDLRRQFSNLRMLSKWEPNQIKITPERIYSMEMHPGDKKLAFAGDKVGYLGIWDVDGVTSTTIKSELSDAIKNEDDDEEDEDLEVEDPAIHHFKLHARAITAMAFDPVNASKLYTSSQDASIRCLDLATGVSDEVFASLDDQAVTGLQIQPDSSVLYFSTLQGELGVRDLRAPPQTQEFHQLHDRKIGAIGMHPHDPHLIVTSSLDRTMKVWDLRKVFASRKKKPAPELRASHTASLSVSSAFFNQNGSVVATSYDNSLKVFHVKDWRGVVEEDIQPDINVSHNNTTGRWLTIFKAAWQQRPADGIQKFVVGNMKRKMDVYNDQGEILTQFENEYITAVPAVVAMHPSQNWVIGGNASGRAYLFS